MAMLISNGGEGSNYDPGSVCVVHLSQSDIALVIDALLQAEMTLPLLDPRYREMKAVDHLRARQLALANQFEELLANERSARSSGIEFRLLQSEE